MSNLNPSAVDVSAAAPDYVAPDLRVFSYLRVDGSIARYSSHFYDASTGSLIFIDEVLKGDKRVWYYRKTVAAGQWTEVEEVTPAVPSGGIN